MNAIFEGLWRLLGAVVHLMSLPFRWAVVSLTVRPMRLRARHAESPADLGVALASFDPCRIGPGGLETYAEIAHEARSAAGALGHVTDRECAKILLRVMERHGCTPSPLGLRMSSRLLARCVATSRGFDPR